MESDKFLRLGYQNINTKIYHEKNQNYCRAKIDINN